jgi:hypothetical protein
VSPFCDTPGQSVAVGLLSGLVGGGVGLAAGLDAVAVAALAGLLALGGEVGAHVVRGDEQWREAIAALR